MKNKFFRRIELHDEVIESAIIVPLVDLIEPLLFGK